MKEPKVRICRLCFSLLDEEFDFITNLQTEMLHIILPELNINVPQNIVVICSNCSESLDQAFTFKSTFLEIEDTIHSYKDDSQEPVNLEQVIGINDMPGSISKDGKVCRICLQLLEDDNFLKLNKENKPLIEVLRKCLPEMDIQLTKHPMICHTCITALEKCFNFITFSLKNEAIIKDYLKLIDCADTDLYDVVRYSWSSEIENRNRLNKTENDIHVKDEVIATPTRINETIAQNERYLHNPTLINLNSESKENDIYVISDDDEEANKVDSSSITAEINVETNKTDLTVLNVGNSELSNDGNATINTDKKRRKSYLKAVETLAARVTELDELSDNGSENNIEMENSDKDVINKNFSKKRKGVTHEKKAHKSIEWSEDENTIDAGDLDVSDRDSVYSIMSENSDDDVGSFNSNKSKRGLPLAKKQKKSVGNNTSTEKSQKKSDSEVMELSANQNVYTIESDDSDEGDASSISVYSNNSKNDEVQEKSVRNSEAIEAEVTISDDEVGEIYNCTEQTFFVANNMVELYKCTHCSFEVPDKQLFDKHFREYQNYKVKDIRLRVLEKDNELFSCVNCLFQTQNKMAMSRHILEYHVESLRTSYMCTVCCNSYEDRDGVAKCHPELRPFVMYKCPFCTFHFDQRARLTNHILHHSAGNYCTKYFCKLCFFACKSTEELLRHFVRHKVAEEIVSYKCLKCSYQSANRVFVQEHIKKAHGRIESKCNRNADKPKDNRNWTEELRNYARCPICSKYMKYGSISHHKRHHKFPCDLCQYNTHSQKGLDKHKSLHVYALEGSVYTCPMCFMMFKRAANLEKHMKVHRDPRILATEVVL